MSRINFFRGLKKSIQVGLFCLGSSSWAGSLLVYCSQDAKYVDPLMELFQAKNPDCVVKIIYLKPDELEKRLNKEFSVSESSADMVFVHHQRELWSLKRDQRLLAVPLDKKQPLLKESYDMDHSYYGTRLINVGIGYLEKEGSSGGGPKSWGDLAQEKYKNHLVLPAPSNLEALHVYSLWANFKENLISTLLQLSPKIVGSLKESTSLIGLGNTEVGLALDSQIVKAKNDGVENIKFIYPSEGVIPLFDGVAVIKTTKNVSEALKLMNFLLSEEAQKKVTNMGFISIRSDLLTPLGYPTLRKISFVPERGGDKEESVKNILSVFQLYNKNNGL